MKKIKHLILAIILILILFPTCVQAATDADISNALTNFIRGMEKWDTFEDSDEFMMGLVYDGNYRYGNRVAFSRASFVDYVYKNVFGFDMKNGNKLLHEGDLDDLNKKNSNFSKGGSGSLKDVKSSLIAGDIIRVDRPLKNDYYLIYLGNNKFAMFWEGHIYIKDYNKDGEMGDWGSSIFSSVQVFHLKNRESLDIKMTTAPTLTNTTMEEEYKKLGLTAKLVENGNTNYAVEINKSIGEVLKAIRTGYYSQYGKKSPIGVTSRITYKGTNDYISINSNYDAYEDILDMASSDNYERDVNRYLLCNVYNSKISFEEYKSQGYASPYINYFTFEKDKSLYLKLEFESDSEGKIIKIVEISNGKDEGSFLEAFDDWIISLDARFDEFVSFVPGYPEKTKEILYELNFTNAKDAKISKENVEFKKNTKGEILFTVNKSGNYIIEGLHNGDSENIENICNGIYTSNGEFASALTADWPRKLKKVWQNSRGIYKGW